MTVDGKRFEVAVAAFKEQILHFATITATNNA